MPEQEENTKMRKLLAVLSLFVGLGVGGAAAAAPAGASTIHRCTGISLGGSPVTGLVDVKLPATLYERVSATFSVPYQATIGIVETTNAYPTVVLSCS